MKAKLRKATYPTRIQDAFASLVLDRLGEFLAPITRKAMKSKISDKDITKSYLHQTYNIPNRYAHGIKVDVGGRLDSYVECLKLNIEQLSVKVKLLTKKLRGIANPERRKYLEIKLNNKAKKLAKAKEELKTKKYSYTFGSNKLFRAQFHLKENGYKSHQEWLDDWRLHRNYNFYIIGSKTESYGNQNCQLIPRPDSGFDLRLRIPDGLLESLASKEKATYFGLTKNIKKTEEEIKLDTSILAGLESGRKKSKYLVIKNLQLPKNEKKKKEILRGFNFLREMLTINRQAITTRFHKDKKGWVFSATTNYKEIVPMTTHLNGLIGVDLNKSHLSITETDKDGNPIKWFDIPLELDGLSSNARDNLISHRVLELIRYAQQRGKDIVVERLDFAKKKRELGILHGPAYNRMLSSFSYRKILNRIEASGYYRGVNVHSINPAYSSLIGRFKFAQRYGLTTHQAAALVIARRYLGLSERLPKSIKVFLYWIGRDKYVLEKPEEDSKHPWKRWAKLQRQINKLWAQRKSRARDPALLENGRGRGQKWKRKLNEYGMDGMGSAPSIEVPAGALESKSTMRAVALSVVTGR